MLYFGAAGVIWALDYLQRVGATSIIRDYSEALVSMAARNRADLQLSESQSRSYLMGDVGIELAHWSVCSSEDIAERIYRAVAANIDNPAREFMWGSPGTMLAALFMFEFTQDARWKELYLRNIGHILGELVKVNEIGCYTWTQDLYGQTSLYLGAVHGFAANILAIIRGKELLDTETISLTEQIATDTIVRAASADENYANWPPALGQNRFLMQHCHGAPGMINCFAKMPNGINNEFDTLLLRGGDLIWNAGPLTKGSNLCHGTAGNGYAFLKLFKRTGNSVWLDRARAFATHAIAQWQRHTRRYGRMRYSLWTGDLGLAIYLWNCIHGQSAFPTMDIF